jgi:hypothetical protein
MRIRGFLSLLGVLCLGFSANAQQNGQICAPLPSDCNPNLFVGDSKDRCYNVCDKRHDPCFYVGQSDEKCKATAKNEPRTVANFRGYYEPEMSLAKEKQLGTAFLKNAEHLSAAITSLEKKIAQTDPQAPEYSAQVSTLAQMTAQRDAITTRLNPDGSLAKDPKTGQPYRMSDIKTAMQGSTLAVPARLNNGATSDYKVLKQQADKVAEEGKALQSQQK